MLFHAFWLITFKELDSLAKHGQIFKKTSWTNISESKESILNCWNESSAFPVSVPVTVLLNASIWSLFAAHEQRLLWPALKHRRWVWLMLSTCWEDAVFSAANPICIHFQRIRTLCGIDSGKKQYAVNGHFVSDSHCKQVDQSQQTGPYQKGL